MVLFYVICLCVIYMELGRSSSCCAEVFLIVFLENSENNWRANKHFSCLSNVSPQKVEFIFNFHVMLTN